jgi:hypothetical protein
LFTKLGQNKTKVLVSNFGFITPNVLFQKLGRNETNVLYQKHWFNTLLRTERTGFVVKICCNSQPLLPNVRKGIIRKTFRHEKVRAFFFQEMYPQMVHGVKIGCGVVCGGLLALFCFASTSF